MFSADRLKSFASIDVATESGNDNWDENFEGDLVTIRGPRKFVEADTQELETIRPYPSRPRVNSNAVPSVQSLAPMASKNVTRKRSITIPSRPKSSHKSQPAAKFALPARPAALFREQTVEDYSDLYFENESVFDRRLNLLKVPSPPQIMINDHLLNTQKDDALSPKLFHPSDLTSLPRAAQSPVIGGSMRRQPAPRPDFREQSMRRANSSVEIQRYAEDEDDEDFSDIFANEPGTSEQDMSERGSDDGAFMLHSKLSNNSWLGDEDDEDDPFASLEQGFDEMDLQANIARDKHARLCALVEGIVSSLKKAEDEEMLSDLSEQLVRALSVD
jgi:hypothetical protein